MNRPSIALVRLAMILAGAAGGCGCGVEPRGPFLAGGREVQAWVADLKSPKPQVRRQAVMKLGNVGDEDPAAAEALETALHDADALVRHDAVIAVVKLKEPGEGVVESLRAMAKSDQDPRARDAAAKALVKLGRGE